MRQEADEVNENANGIQVLELYGNMKNGNTTFKTICEKQLCDPNKLKENLNAHFKIRSEFVDSVELKDATSFIRQLQDINNTEINTTPPDKEELRPSVKPLRNGKPANDLPFAYVKHATQCKEFTHEVMKLFETIWRTNKIHSKLVALWKGPSKGKQIYTKSYQGLQIGSSLNKMLLFLIISRLKNWYEKQIMEQQKGFRCGRGTAYEI